MKSLDDAIRQPLLFKPVGKKDDEVEKDGQKEVNESEEEGGSEEEDGDELNEKKGDE